MDDVLVFAASAPRRPSFMPFLIAGMVGPLALLALALWFGGQARRIDDSRLMIRASYEKRQAATDLMYRLVEAETSQHAFIITDNARFLTLYEASRAEVAMDLARLDDLYTQQPDQQARVARMRLLIGTKFQEMAEVIRLRRTGGLSAAAERFAAGRGVTLTEQARANFSALITTEESALASRLEYVSAHNRATRNFIWSLVVLSGLILLLGLWALWRARTHRYRVERRAHREAARLRAIFASTTDAIMILDPHGKIEATNAAATRMLGYSPSELIGRDASSLLDVADGEGSFHDRIGLIDGRLGHPNWLDRTVRHRNERAVPVDIALGLMPLPGELHIVAAIRDISERKALERLKDEFVATVSHELRTPLTSVVGSLGLLRAGSMGELPESAHRLVEIAENNSRRLIRLINDILDIEKIGSGRMHFERQPLDLVKTVARAIEDSRGLAEAHQTQLELSAPREMLLVRGDEDRLLQVVANLLSNAIRFSPDHGCVRVLLSSDNGQAIVAVEDEGPGIPPEFHGRIFERFAQASGATPRIGTGLGLAISREIIAAHEGRIWFGKAEGGGARLSFSLPLLQRGLPPESARAARILICEPHAETAKVLTAMLEGEGWEVDCVGTAGEASDEARLGRYDAMVIELDLPDGGGPDTVRALRRNAETRALPAIILASAVGDEGKGEAAALDMVDWIDKPVERQRLLDALRRAIDHSVAARPTILHVDDDVDMLEVTAVALAEQGRILHATSVASARRLLAGQAPDIVILDLVLPDGSGLDLLPDLLRADGSAIPTIIYSAEDVRPTVKRRVDAVLVKSRRSLPTLARTIRRILASASTELETP